VPRTELTRDTLRQAALAYVARRETTRAHLRDLLRRRVRSHVSRHGAEATEPSETEGWIEDVLDTLQ